MITFNTMNRLYYLLPLLVCFLTACQSSSVIQPKQQKTALLPTPEQQIFVDAEQQQTQKPVIALVLGSGGARGYAHIGVLEVLEKQGIYPDFIVGTSAGSLAGVLYASGKSAHELRTLAQNLKVADVKEFDLGLQSVFDGQKIEDFVNRQVGNQTLEQLKIPMYVVATRLDNGEATVFNYGNAGQAVRASIAIPTMFAPVKIGQNEYVDGGLVSPVPVKVAKNLGADMIIAVNILAVPHHTKTHHMWGLFNQNINIMQNHLANEELQYADVVIQPDIREKSHIFDVKARSHSMLAGQTAALNKIKDIQQRLQQLQTEISPSEETVSPQNLAINTPVTDGSHIQ